MTAEELVSRLESRGIRLEPEGPDRLAYEPASRVTPEELAALRRLKPAVLTLLRQRHRLSPWPDSIGGHPREVAALGLCLDCPADPPPPAPARSESRTWCRYGERYLCLRHALRAEAHERIPS